VAGVGWSGEVATIIERRRRRRRPIGRCTDVMARVSQ